MASTDLSLAVKTTIVVVDVVADLQLGKEIKLGHNGGRRDEVTGGGVTAGTR